MTHALYRDISLQVTTDANRIPQRGTELRRINGPLLAAGHEMLSRVSMATLAGDARMEKGQPTITIDGAGIAVLYRTHMTAQALRLHRQRRRRLGHRFEAGLHVQTLPRGVVGNGRLKEVAIERVKVGQAKMPGSQKVFELAAGGDLRIFRVLITQHQLRAFKRQAVFHAGELMLKGSSLY